MNPYVEKAVGKFLTLDEQFRALSLRERIILGGGLIALVVFGIDSAAIQPISQKIDRVNLSLERTEADLRSLEAQSHTLTAAEPSDEEKRFLERKRLLLAQLGEVDAQISKEISGLVPPQAIVSVLEEILTPIRSLQVVRLKSLKPHRIGSDDARDSANKILESTSALYRHGVRIEIEGDFAATLEFLERAETSRWHLLWDRLEYEVSEFPSANITIDIHTISDRKEWIGV